MRLVRARNSAAEVLLDTQKDEGSSPSAPTYESNKINSMYINCVLYFIINSPNVYRTYAMKYRFIQDEDCHWYLIPADKVDDFNRWVECGPYWDGYEGEWFEDYSCDYPSSYSIENPERD